MITVDMTVREMVALASNPSCTGDLYERIVKALEVATGNVKLLVACNGVHYDGQFWDQKIPAIRSVRFATGWGLKEAKDWVEVAQHDRKTAFTGPLDPETAKKLQRELEACGCSCWTTPA